MRQVYREAVKYEIEHVFGRTVFTARDCAELSDEIFKKTNQQLNPNTLRRFFGLVKSEYPPSHSTLTILSQYCGFQSAEELYKMALRERSGVDKSNHENLVYYFISMFEEITVNDCCDSTFLSIVEHTIKFLNKHPGLTDKFQSLVAKTKNGQEYYFEQFVNIDKFNLFFTNGLRYYLNEKRTGEGMIFAHAVLVFKYWLNNDKTKLEEYYSKMIRYAPSGSYNGYIYCRYYAAILFYNNIQAMPGEDVLVSIFKFYSTLEALAPADQLFYFEYVISEALVLTGHYNDTLFYIDQFLNRLKTMPLCKPKMSVENIKLFKAMALHKTRKTADATVVFNTIKPAGFLFISRKCASILYIFLSMEINKKIYKQYDSIESLLAETGFNRLKDFQPEKNINQ